MFKISPLVFILFISFQLSAQDSIPKWKFNFQFDDRISSIRNNSIVLIGAKFGYQYKKLTRIGLGTSFLLKPVEFEYINKRTSRVVTNNVDFWYFSIYNDWILYHRHHFEVFITEQVGFGKPRYIRELGDEVFGVGAGIGYRSLFNKQSLLTSTFDAPIYMAKLIVYPEGVIDLIKKSAN
jgi:hypothetical protein